MIDVNAETLLTFSQLARRIPHRRNGRPTHVSTIHRWRSVGVKGVVLDAVRIGSSWATSLEAYARFCAALTIAAGGSMAQTPTRTRSVDARLDALGL